MTRWLANRAVRTKVLLVVAILGVVAVAGAALASVRLHELKTEAKALYVRGLLPVAGLSEAAMSRRWPPAPRRWVPPSPRSPAAPPTPPGSPAAAW
ncbi:hypothetical protein ACQEVZ_09170 [Dactylosporangium sp. CA-152071]|uniref:hypothetical protein n=1 Tax=Dactylosporangium sp. CA-152071 TaxID=3239933 RepID=UPI003D89BC16